MEIGTPDGLRNRAFAGSSPALRTTTTANA